jgi:hypothetical protein
MTENADAEVLAKAAKEIAVVIKRRKKEKKKANREINLEIEMRKRRRNIKKEEDHLLIQDHDKSSEV